MRVLKWSGIIACTVLLSGCLSPIKTAPLSTYTITNWKQVPAPAHAVSRKTVVVMTPIASPGYRTADMIYVMIPFELRSFANNRWVAPPAELLLPLLENRIRRTGYFHAVVSAPFTGVANYQLNTRLLVLQQEFLQPQSAVRLKMQATIVSIATGRVIASRDFQAVVPADQNNPYGGVLAANKAAHGVMAQIARFVVARVR
jgi:cholesterol transport system auxiliary component